MNLSTVTIQEEEREAIISTAERKDIQSQCFEHPVARRFRRSFWTTRRKKQQHPVESSYESAVAIYIQSQALHPVDMDSQTQRIKDISRR
ncbi:hypothetical protein F511_20174 [Dorcoceras hygrometricum]|uniref:Uncharacterized protein n=1 Tax=Dorcoceras hygrometricum TaxID=472368 RepID=A0A2Z7DEV9_9LAMI|nr:hypothetical protein F511_20174 [Dorcoceras hygrometricum]